VASLIQLFGYASADDILEDGFEAAGRAYTSVRTLVK
jgi:hypothetical protein